MNNKNLKKPNIYSSRRGFLRVKMRDCKTKWLNDYFFTGEDTEGAAVPEIGHHKFPLRLRSRKVDGVCLQCSWSHDAPSGQLTRGILGKRDALSPGPHQMGGAR